MNSFAAEITPCFAFAPAPVLLHLRLRKVTGAAKRERSKPMRERKVQ
jgi:hypothetical protein